MKRKMILSFHPCIKTDLQIILGDRLPNEREMEFIQDADAIILPQGCKKELYHICSCSEAELFPEYRYRYMYTGKVGQMKLFQGLKLPFPCSICCNDFEDLFQKWDSLSSKTPFLLKEDRKHEGAGVHIIGDLMDVKRLSERSNKSDPLIVQELIECGGNVLRVVVVGKKIFSYWKRSMDPHQFITSISTNAIIDYDWMPHLQDKGTALVRKFISKTGINLAAIDIIFKANDIPLLLEINYYFGRRGIGGTERYYQLLYKAIQEWLKDKGLSSRLVELIY